MATQSNPIFGITQPNYGMRSAVFSARMPRRSKGPPSAQLVRVRAALAINLRAHIAAHPVLRGLDDTPAAEELNKLTGVGKNTILRALGRVKTDDDDSKGDARLDILVALATFFGVRVEDLLRDHSHSSHSRKSAAKANNKHNESARAEGKDAENRAPLQRRRSA